MLIHYLKITFRNIVSNKFRYLLTTLGLSVGMVIFSIIFFFADGSNGMWNKKTTNENLFMFVTSYFTESGKPPLQDRNEIVDKSDLEKILNQKLPEIEAIGMITSKIGESYVCVENNSDLMYQAHCRNVNDKFFELAEIEIVKGSITESWNVNKSVVLTDDFAKKLFGNSEIAIGQRIERRTEDNHLYGAYTVIAVVKKIIDINFSSDIYVPLNSDGDKYLKSIVQIKENVQLEKLNLTVASITTKKLENYRSNISNANTKLQLMPYNERGKGIAFSTYLALLLMGSLVLIVALFNFANLLIVSMQVHIRQFTLRKIVGANGGAFLLMLLCEIIPVLITATFLCYLILELLYNWYQSSVLIPIGIRNNLNVFLPLMFQYPIKIAFLTFFFCFILAIILIKRIQKIVLVQGIRGHFFKTRNFFFRNILLFFQTLITFIFLQISILVFFTTKHTLPKTYQSLSKEQSNAVLIVPLDQLKLINAHQEISNRIKSLSGVLQTTTEYRTSLDYSFFYITVNNSELAINTTVLFDGYDTFWEVNDPLFKRNLAPDEVIINRNLADRLQKESVTTLNFNNQEHKIVGVVEQIPYTDYNKYEILVSTENRLKKLCVAKCTPNQVKTIEKEIMTIIREYLPVTIDYRIISLDDDISIETRLTQKAITLLAIATIFSLIITLLGIYTTISYDVKRKRKEIAIRKINGATRKDIAKSFAKLYSIILLISGFAGILLYRFIITKFYNPSNVKYDFNIGLEFAIWLLLALVVAFTIFAQIQKAVSENPADVVKSE